jgi:hypothetical protein
MATRKTKSLTAEYERDTAKGKRRYRIDEDGIAGTIYVSPDHELADADTIELSLKAVEAE